MSFVYGKKYTPRFIVCHVVDGDVMDPVNAGQVHPKGGVWHWKRSSALIPFNT